MFQHYITQSLLPDIEHNIKQQIPENFKQIPTEKSNSNPLQLTTDKVSQLNNNLKFLNNAHKIGVECNPLLKSLITHQVNFL